MDERVDATVCYRHPDRPTRLACTECGRPICVECSIDAAVGQKCPECAEPVGRARVIDARRTTGRRSGFTGAPITRFLVYTSVALYILGALNGDIERWLSGAFFQNLATGQVFYDPGAFEHYNPALADGELWRMVTYAFLHGSTLHILFNMYVLYLFGPELERRVGSLPFALFYAAAAAGGSAAVYIVRPDAVPVVGASGAIYGLFGAWIFVSWRLRHTPAGRAQFSQLLVLLAINLALPFFVPNVAWEAHLGGLAFGVGIAAAWAQFAAQKPRAEQRRSAIGGVFLAVAVIAVLVLPVAG
jgi:membrane associated rhomboid family serine protease